VATALETGTRSLAPDVRVRAGSRLAVWLLVAFLAGLVLVPAAVGSALLAWDATYDGRVLPGVRAAGVDLSGLDRAQAAAALDPASRQRASGRILVVTPDGPMSVSYVGIGRALDTDAMIDEALLAGRQGSPLERALGEPRQAVDGLTVADRIRVDEAALRTALQALLASLERTPLDATVAKGATGFYATRARPGRTFDADAVVAEALAAVLRPDAPDTIEVTAVATPLPVSVGDATALAAKTAAERMATRVDLALEGRSWSIPASVVRAWIGFAIDAGGSPRAVLDEAAIPAALEPITAEVARKPVSARYIIAKGGGVGVKAGRDGRSLDLSTTASLIAAELRTRADGAAPSEIALVVAPVEPKLTTAQAKQTASRMKRLSSWKTWFPIADRNYWGANIWIPAKLINGTVLQPGETFEWWRAVGPVTRARGFGPGGYIAGDHTEPTGAMGGGMCSSSTTLFNAALRAGLEMGKRTNHRYYISRYPRGLDATVSGSQTMSFTNDMDTPIMIRGYRIVGSNGRGWVRYEIWGVPDGRAVRIGRPAVSNIDRAVTSVRTTDTLPHGERKQTEYPADGMDVRVTRVVRDANGGVLHREVWKTRYQRWDGLILVGR
jgi:vancomycin resistance protein YoaR